MEIYKEENRRIKNLLKDNPRGLSVTDISKKIGINRNTVSKYLEILRISGHVEMDSVGTAKVYFLSQRIPVSTLLDFSSDNIVVIDSEHKVIQANDRFADLVNIPKKEITDRRIDDILISMLSNRTLIEKIDEGLKGKELVEILDLIIKNELCFFKTKIIPSTFDDGEAGVTLIMENITEDVNLHNSLKEQQEILENRVSERTAELERSNELLKKEITERKNAEEQILEENTKAQNYLDVAGVLIIVLDENKNCTLINKKGLEILECTNEDIIGKNLIDNFILESERDDVNSRCYRILNDGCEINCESHIITPTGKKKLIKWINVSLKDKNGKHQGIIASGQDITEQRRIENELKENEEKYRLLAANTLDSIWKLDKNLVFTDANPATNLITDLESQDLIGTKLQDHFPETEMKKMMEIMSYSIKHGSLGDFTKIETSIYNKKRNLVPIDIYAKVLFDENGNFCGLQGTTRRRTNVSESQK